MPRDGLRPHHAAGTRKSGFPVLFAHLGDTLQFEGDVRQTEEE
jgi:hypothetical protein